MNRAVSLVVCSILLGLFTASSCEEESTPCPEDCFSRLTLYVRPVPPAIFAAGSYRLEALVDGEVLSCNFSVISERTVHYDCGEREILAAPDLIFVTFPGTPAAVDVSLWKGETAILETSLAPEYEISNPGGADCGPGCEAADEEFYVTP